MSKIRRRVGGGGIVTSMGKGSCPDCFELDSGDFAVIGTDVTDEIVTELPADASCSDKERIVVIPRTLLASIIRDFEVN